MVARTPDHRDDGILNGPIDGPRRMARQYPEVFAVTGLAVRHRASGFTGAVISSGHDEVTVRGVTGLDRVFRLTPGAFAVDGRPVTLLRVRSVPSVAPAGAGGATSGAGPATTVVGRTASGSVAVRARARVARESRILVEGVHDAELVEKVWGDDLRVEGVVVERLDGADHLASVVQAFAPGGGRRLGVLLDHLRPGTKEDRIATEVARPGLLVTGHPYVDIWQAVRPRAAGIDRWPDIAPGQPWKEGVCAALGAGDPRTFWRALLAKVTSYADLEPGLVGAVESLIDFVTEPA